MNQYGYNPYNTYGNYMPPYMRTNPIPTAPAPNTGINWVLGIENAKSFYVEPGKSAILMDSEKEMFYIKTVDLNGMGSIKAYTFTEAVEPPKETAPAFDPTQFVTKTELATVLESLRQKAPENKALI